ncbi:MAG: DUF3488 domain-containing transglutaminase family protein, partial [Gammaproteobacteria bacterium]|nr:DUF3488 domain-containing transglutaminase family protein [Gammaproteobacteria bacterium]
MNISRAQLIWLTVALTGALLPHAARFHPAIVVCFVTFALWRLAGAAGVAPLPDKQHRVAWTAKHVLAFGAFFGAWAAYGGQPGRDAGVALLSVLMGLKLLELKNERDMYIVIFLGYFLVATNFFYSQTPLTAAYLLAIIVLLTSALVAFNLRQPAGIALAMREGMIITVQAVPVMLLLFYLFPRLGGPLWGVPTDLGQAVTGLSEEMNPGEISDLTLSDRIAFRAAFDGPRPDSRELYWRGPVLWNTDGRIWRSGRAGDGPPHRVETGGRPYRYEITLEPHHQRWLFALEMATRTDARATTTRDQCLLAPRQVRRRISYRATSHTVFAQRELTGAERGAALALPPDAHPQTRALADRWRRESDGGAALVERALSWFNDEAFFYTLTPTRMAGDTVDLFLFDTRRGFCEHYASAFVVLMRAAGVPARVVTGYQGGDYNPVGDYLVVRQRHAHAWTEVWLDDSGWQRVDPTAAVAPSRVEGGIDEVLPARGGLLSFSGDSAAASLARRIADLWDAANYSWSHWVLGYNVQRQRQLLDRLGLDDVQPAELAAVLLLLLGAAVLTVAFSGGRRRRTSDPVALAYQRFCARLAALGIERRPSEG